MIWIGILVPPLSHHLSLPPRLTTPMVPKQKKDGINSSEAWGETPSLRPLEKNIREPFGQGKFPARLSTGPKEGCHEEMYTAWRAAAPAPRNSALSAPGRRSGLSGLVQSGVPFGFLGLLLQVRLSEQKAHTSSFSQGI